MSGVRAAAAFNTLSLFKAIPGMAGLYSTWSRNSGSRFHYVSGGPDQMEKPMETLSGRGRLS